MHSILRLKFEKHITNLVLNLQEHQQNLLNLNRQVFEFVCFDLFMSIILDLHRTKKPLIKVTD
jgi:hypothetical protein